MVSRECSYPERSRVIRGREGRRQGRIGEMGERDERGRGRETGREGPERSRVSSYKTETLMSVQICKNSDPLAWRHNFMNIDDPVGMPTISEKSAPFKDTRRNIVPRPW